MKNVGLELEDMVSGTAAGAELRAAPAQPTTGHSGAAHPGTEPGTRARIARLILEHGPVTAAGLSGRLGLTPAAVRRHLDNLLTDGMIEAREARCYGSRGRGRPARMFAITDAGRSAFEHAYDDLAASALRFLAERAAGAASTTGRYLLSRSATCLRANSATAPGPARSARKRSALAARSS